MQIVVATSNPHKLREIAAILKTEVRGQAVKVVENGKTFSANAIKKVEAVKLKPGEIALADDSGLMVDCLGGKPGVRSARFASPPTAENFCNKLLRVMRLRKGGRGAAFVCVIALKYPSGEVIAVKGICRGKIIYEMRGEHGFGYDPVFVPQGYKKTFAQMKPAMKNRLSHRVKALRQVKHLLTRIIHTSRV